MVTNTNIPMQKMMFIENKLLTIWYEYIPNIGSLENLLSSQILPFNLRCKLWKDIKRILNEIHCAGVAHGDFRCKNIMVKPDYSLYICDFELSQVSDQEKLYDDDKRYSY